MRLISISCTLASAPFLAQVIRILSQDRIAAASTGLLFLAFPYVVDWSSLARVDLPALALSTAGLYALIQRLAARWRLVACALLLAAAIYTRKSYALAAPLATFAWLWVHDRRRAIGLAALVGGVSLALFVILKVLTRGGFFFNIVSGNVNEFDIDRLGQWLGGLSNPVPILLVLGGAFLSLPLCRIKSCPLIARYLVEPLCQR